MIENVLNMFSSTGYSHLTSQSVHELAYQNINDISDLSHKDLKLLKTGTATIQCQNVNRTFKVTWSERSQKFSVRKEGTDFLDGISNVIANHTPCGCCLHAAKIASALNRCEQTDALKRNAAHNPLQSDGIKNLLTRSTAQDKTITIAYGGQESPVLPPGVTTSSSALHEPPHLLVYGLSQSRSRLIDKMNQNFNLSSAAGMATIDQYNECLGLDLRFGFEAYCQLCEAKSGSPSLAREIKSNKVTTIAAQVYAGTHGSDRQKVIWLKQRVTQWAQHLSNSIPINFSQKLNDNDPALQRKKRVTFVLKNALPNEFISEHKTSTLTTRQHYNNKNWSAFLNSLDPVLDCIQSLDGNMNLTAAKNKYAALSATQKQKVDILINTHFFRRTSKAGLSFAHSTDAKILFSWNAPEARNIAALHTMLQTRLYNDQNPSFRAEKYHEAITFSEMRELGRLQQRGVAPDYLLVSKINNQPI